MSDTTVRLCSPQDISRVMDFIETNWKSGHIMAHDQVLVDFQHKQENGDYTFYIAEENSKLCGILGFIPTSHFDPALASGRSAWLAIWKNIGSFRAGLQLLDAVSSENDSVGAIGINATVAKLYDLLHYQVDDLVQYYLPDPDIADFKIASIPRPEKHESAGGTDLVSLDAEGLSRCDVPSIYYPLKSKQYFINRYFRHPYYKYKILAAVDQGGSAVQAVFAVRAIDVNGSRCLRIIDVLGDMDKCRGLEAAFLKLLREERAEYIDCLNYGLPQELFRRHGFEVAGPDRVIPNYFEPFLQQYVPIKFAVLNKTDRPYVIFKGDGDQDRPNRTSKGN